MAEFLLGSLKEFLKLDFQKRKSKNPRYSLRSYARFLNVPVATLSRFFQGNAVLSFESAERIFRCFSFTDAQIEFFRKDLATLGARSLAKQKNTKEEISKMRQKHFTILEEDRFKPISEWHCFAILSLMDLPDYLHDEQWIAERLNLNPARVRQDLEHMLRVGMITFDSAANRWIVNANYHVMSTPAPSKMIREYHRQVLSKAVDAIESQPHLMRDFNSLVLSFDSCQVAQAKEMITAFKDLFDSRFSRESRRPKDSVYTLNIQFFRLDQDNVQVTDKAKSEAV